MLKSLKGFFEKPISVRSMNDKLRKYNLETNQVVLACYRAAMSDYRVYREMCSYDGEFFAKESIIYARNYNYWLWIGFVLRIYENLFKVDFSGNSADIMKSDNSTGVKIMLIKIHNGVRNLERRMSKPSSIMPIYPGSDYDLN